MKKNRFQKKKIAVIYNGIGEEFLHPPALLSREEIAKKFSLSAPYFLYTGVWRNHKNVLGLLEAFLLLIQDGLCASLVITGKPDPYYPEVLDFIQQNHLEERVKTVGLVDELDLLALYASAKAYIFPSFYEGFGMPPLESMAMGVPVAASNTSCIPEICSDAAEFFSPYDTVEMARAMKTVFCDEPRRKILIEKGKARIQDFSWDTASRQTLQELETAFLPKK